MIGNDIVDLKLAENQSNWQRRGFLDKTFTKSEQALILSAEDPNLMVWRLWSMKESVYKASRYIERKILINPLQFECQILSPKSGRVIFKQHRFQTTTVFKDGYVLSECKIETCEHSLFSRAISSKSKNLSAEKLYHQLQIDLTEKKGWEKNDIVLKKNDLGIPEVFWKTKKVNLLISLSHHGRFGAYLASC